jgi:hypothetical protein
MPPGKLLHDMAKSAFSLFHQLWAKLVAPNQLFFEAPYVPQVATDPRDLGIVQNR